MNEIGIFFLFTTNINVIRVNTASQLRGKSAMHEAWQSECDAKATSMGFNTGVQKFSRWVATAGT